MNYSIPSQVAIGKLYVCYLIHGKPHWVIIDALESLVSLWEILSLINPE